MSESNEVFVQYEVYCNRCVNKNTPEWEDPCDDCLSCPVNEGSVKPINYKEDPKWGTLK